MSTQEARKYPRSLVQAEVYVNDGTPYQGGRLFDMSVSGAAVKYDAETPPSTKPVEIGQVLFLEFQSGAALPTRVARTFEGGFATQFDFSISYK
jgi:hypothetical protein